MNLKGIGIHFCYTCLKPVTQQHPMCQQSSHSDARQSKSCAAPYIYVSREPLTSGGPALFYTQEPG